MKITYTFNREAYPYSDQEVWRRLVRSIPQFNLKTLQDLSEFAAKSDTRQDMTGEVLQQRVGQLKLPVAATR